MMDLFSSGLSDSPWVTLVSGGSLSHFTSDIESDVILQMCGLSLGLGGMCWLSLHSLYSSSNDTAAPGSFKTSVPSQTWHLVVRQSHRCHLDEQRPFTRESVHVPRRSHKPPAQRRSSRGPEGAGRLESGSKRALCREEGPASAPCRQYVMPAFCENYICIIAKVMVDNSVTRLRRPGSVLPFDWVQENWANLCML